MNNKYEEIILKIYYKEFITLLGAEKLPALIPQVYLHYDPYTIQQLKGEKRVARQRMDFLILLSNQTKIVIEVDGQQHYSDGNKPIPKLYSDMVAEDRKLKLAGYEVYRFGCHELKHTDAEQLASAEQLVKEFFLGLFKKHEIA